LEIRDITSRQDWFQKYEYEIPVLCLVTRPPAESADHAVGQGYLETEVPLPRLSPRSGVAQLEQMLQKYLPADPAQ
jgi:hypothetical protein